jgi:hypothetical protein
VIGVSSITAGRCCWLRLVSLVGAIGGVLLCHVAAWAAGPVVTEMTGVQIAWTTFSADELLLNLGVTAFGGIAGVLPAVKGSMTEVADKPGPVS